MPVPKPLPRKYLAMLEEARHELATIGNQANSIATTLIPSTRQAAELSSRLHEIEARAYRTACELGKIQVTDTDGECPFSPEQTTTQKYLFTLSQSLTEQADMIRQIAAGDLSKMELSKAMRE